MGEEEGSSVNCWRGLVCCGVVCCGVSIVHISVGNGPPVAIQALVMDGELLGYDLLLRMDSITQLGGITVNGTGNIRFS